MFENLRQKARNRPIKITDIAISKIRKTKVLDTEEENKYIQEQHKRLLQISKNQNNNEEVAIVIDIIHWENEVIIGKRNRVKMEDNKKANIMLITFPKNTILVMHNHPSTSTFSGEDFKTFCDNESIYVMTIVGNDGTVQMMKKYYNFEGQTEKIKYWKLANKYKSDGYKNNGTMAMKYIIKHPKEFNIIYRHGGKKK